jgi:hypothetical protein
MMERIDLDPCPFCGGKDILLIPECAVAPIGIEDERLWHAQCECIASGPEAQSREYAAELWNKRCQPTSINSNRL